MRIRRRLSPSQPHDSRHREAWSLLLADGAKEERGEGGALANRGATRSQATCLDRGSSEGVCIRTPGPSTLQLEPQAARRGRHGGTKPFRTHGARRRVAGPGIQPGRSTHERPWGLIALRVLRGPSEHQLLGLRCPRPDHLGGPRGGPPSVRGDDRFPRPLLSPGGGRRVLPRPTKPLPRSSARGRVDCRLLLCDTVSVPALETAAGFHRRRESSLGPLRNLLPRQRYPFGLPADRVRLVSGVAALWGCPEGLRCGPLALDRSHGRGALPVKAAGSRRRSSVPAPPPDRGAFPVSLGAPSQRSASPGLTAGFLCTSCIRDAVTWGNQNSPPSIGMETSRKIGSMTFLFFSSARVK